MIGYTNDRQVYRRAVRFYQAAVTDGWEHRALFAGEPEEQAAELTRDGFTLQILMRTKAHGVTGCWEYDAGWELVGPDRLPANVPRLYTWEGIQAGLRECLMCGARDVETHQLNWRTRACNRCLQSGFSSEK